MPHLSELHGAATHLAVVAVPLYLLILLVRRTGRGGEALAGWRRFRAAGDRAQGLRDPQLAGGVELEEFRGVHGDGLFPPRAVTDKDFAAINAWLRTLPRG